MRKAVLTSMAIGLLALTAAPATAQFGTVERPADTWASAWVGGYISPGTITDSASGTWNFGTAYGGGLGLHHRVGGMLMLGLDVGFAPAQYEITDDDGNVSTGDARIYSAMASGRLRYGGGSSFFLYLTGGAGTLIYDLPALDRMDPDLALLAGAGLEYRFNTDKSLFVEWGRFWNFHQRQGVEDNMTKHGQLRIGVRTGW